MMEPRKGNVEQSVKVCSRLVDGLQVVILPASNRNQDLDKVVA